MVDPWWPAANPGKRDGGRGRRGLVGLRRRIDPGGRGGGRRLAEVGEAAATREGGRGGGDGTGMAGDGAGW